MAAAEARAVWQRAANRCFVQEDAKRAPKLACCPSSSSSSKQADAGHANAADGPDHPPVGFMPLNRTSYSNLPPDTRWWLQLQPNYGYQKGLTSEQLNALEAEVEMLIDGTASKTSELDGAYAQNEDGSGRVDGGKNTESFFDVDNINFAGCVEKDPDFGKQEVNALNSKNAQDLEVNNMWKYYELVETEPIGSSASKQPSELYLDSESSWIGVEKNEPWWRTADTDELASLVVQKSLDHIENCDLPPPQKMHVRSDPFAPLGSFVHKGNFGSSLDRKAQTGTLSNLTLHLKGSSSLGSADGRQWASAEDRHGSDKPFSSYNTNHKDLTEMQGITDNDPSKAQLLEALRHSQTRAREAEKAAKQAHEEKEHIISLFLRQASQLFAYKQWFHLLQLENLYSQIKNKDHPISTLFPVTLPWTPYKAKKQRKSWQKATKGRRGKRAQPRYDISKYAVAFALGLSLVGAGLLLGWTIGWMLPTL